MSEHRFDPEKVAYWYFRLNGFLQIENFVVHPTRRGSQRTDADLVGVRFRHRAEFAFDHQMPMADDEHLTLSSAFDDVAIVEVKTNQPCTLNGPWIKPGRQNVHRVLAAIGCLSRENIPEAAECIYEDGIATFGRIRIRLIAVGRDRSLELSQQYPRVLQLTWNEIIGFIWARFQAYREQKRHSDQWDLTGRVLRQLADKSNQHEFTVETGRRMGLTRREP
jgi:hypothetical protein